MAIHEAGYHLLIVVVAAFADFGIFLHEPFQFLVKGGEICILHGWIFRQHGKAAHACVVLDAIAALHFHGLIEHSQCLLVVAQHRLQPSGGGLPHSGLRGFALVHHLLSESDELANLFVVDAGGFEVAHHIVVVLIVFGFLCIVHEVLHEPQQCGRIGVGGIFAFDALQIANILHEPFNARHIAQSGVDFDGIVALAFLI